MKSVLAALAMTTALTLPGLAQARSVTLTAQMSNYWGNPAYFAVYLTDPAGRYVETLWLAGRQPRYFEHLSGWQRAVGRGPLRLDGVTGASLGAGQGQSVSVEIADSMIDAGYTLHLDAAVENRRESRDEVVLPLTSSGGQAAGRQYTRAFGYRL